MDHRSCYTSVHPLPPDGAEIVIQSSDHSVLDEIETKIREKHERSVKGLKFVLLPEPGSDLPELFLCVTSVADVRGKPSHTSELVTQIIHGDTVFPFKTEGDWLLVRIDDGYIGWIRSWHLKPTTEGEARDFRDRAGHRVAETVTQIYESSTEDALPLSDAVIGTPVISRNVGRRGWREVRLPNGKKGYARARTIEPLVKHGKVSRQRLATTGLKFLGVPYLWGGTTPKGFDCSGLVQRIYKLHGLLLPRDSDVQAKYGKQKRVGRVGALNTGDLLFFGKSERQITHVAMYLSSSLFLHAYGQVRVGSLSAQHPLFEAKLVRDWRFTRDPLSA